MAEPLRNHFDHRVPRRLASRLTEAWPDFSADRFLDDALQGYDELGLMDRGRHIARALRKHLPDAYPRALQILLRSVGDRPARSEGDGGMASFLYLPHVQFVELFGLDHFEPSMRALHLLTQRFTGEFAVRPFLERYEAETLGRLREWTRDPDPHVRRLTSEGTRPRLPWARRLRRFQADPSPVIEILEVLRDDPDPFVRRSVANNLNDIGKDNPDVLLEVARRWNVGASEERLALVRHALRSRVKAGDARALDILGFRNSVGVELGGVTVEPAMVPMGGSVTIGFELRGTTGSTQRLLVDLRVHYVKANGSTSPRVFKLRTVELAPGASEVFSKRLSLADLSTRRHHAGVHRLEVLINGTVEPLGEFLLMHARDAGGSAEARNRRAPSPSSPVTARNRLPRAAEES